ncbi:hypothetical protein CBL_12102 [Carabus blaptoides fortunei]
MCPHMIGTFIRNLLLPLILANGGPFFCRIIVSGGHPFLGGTHCQWNTTFGSTYEGCPPRHDQCTFGVVPGAFSYPRRTTLTQTRVGRYRQLPSVHRRLRISFHGSLRDVPYPFDFDKQAKFCSIPGLDEFGVHSPHYW